MTTPATKTTPTTIMDYLTDPDTRRFQPKTSGIYDYIYCYHHPGMTSVCARNMIDDVWASNKLNISTTEHKLCRFMTEGQQKDVIEKRKPYPVFVGDLNKLISFFK